VVEVLDLRGLDVWERSERVVRQADELAAGASIEFITEIDPRALLARLEQLRPHNFAAGHRRLGEREWHVTLSRIALQADAPLLQRAFASSPVLSTLPDEARDELRGKMRERTGRKGEVICGENEPCDTLGVVLEGTLAAFIGAGSRERLLFELYPFDVFGQIELFDSGLSIGRTTILSKNARYAEVPQPVAYQTAMRYPEFSAALALGIAQHARTLASALAEHVSRPILARVAGALLPYAPPERGLHVVLPPLSTMTQAQIAASAGTVKEVAARAIAELERLEALRRERGHIKYLDRAKLLETLKSP
jgi:CRP-like cAMP-binding protein